jgi:hypothetical protein
MATALWRGAVRPRVLGAGVSRCGAPSRAPAALAPHVRLLGSDDWKKKSKPVEESVKVAKKEASNKFAKQKNAGGDSGGAGPQGAAGPTAAGAGAGAPKAGARAGEAGADKKAADKDKKAADKTSLASDEDDEDILAATAKAASAAAAAAASKAAGKVARVGGKTVAPAPAAAPTPEQLATAAAAAQAELLAGAGDTPAARARREKPSAALLAGVVSVRDLGPQHRCMIYESSAAELARLLPEGTSGELKKEMELTMQHKDCAQFLVREPFLRALGALEAVERGSPPAESALMLSGLRGTGKSYTLTLLVMRARAAGWLTLFEPSAREWVTEKGAFLRGTGTAAPYVESKVRPGMMNQPVGSQAILRFFEGLHGEQVKKLPRRREYKHKAYDGEDKSLYSIVNRGLKSALYAGDALLDLRLELSLVEEVPVLVACDEVNALYWPGVFYEKGRALAPSQFLHAEAFRALDAQGALREGHKLKRGLVVGATSSKHGWPVPPDTIIEHANDTGQRYFAPFSVRGEVLKNKHDGVLDIVGENLSLKELRNLLLSYRRTEAIFESEVLKPHNMQMLHALTNSNPYQVRKYLAGAHIFLQDE